MQILIFFIQYNDYAITNQKKKRKLGIVTKVTAEKSVRL